MNKILLIENENSGKSYRELLLKSIENIDVVWVKGRSDAITAFKNNHYKIVVYDQRLDNNELGTDIMLDLKKLDANILGIMLSAYATPQDTTQAGKDGILFDYCNKNEVQKLPIKIMEALKYYDISKALNVKQEKSYIGKIYRNKLPFYPVKFYIISKILIDSNYVFDNSWEDLYMINAGEEQCQKKSIEISTTIKITNDYNHSFEGDISNQKLERLIDTKFKSYISFSANENYEEHKKIVEEVVKNYKMPPIPNSVDEDYLTTTILQGGQVYKKFNIEILQECTLCKIPTYHCFTIYVPTNKQRLRKINTYRFGKQEIIEVSPRT